MPDTDPLAAPARAMTYGDYLQLDRLLGAQRCLSAAHDELLFIIQHQTSELWMHLVLHELDAARALIAADRVREAFKMLARVSRIFEQLNGAWDVLRTMTPSEYSRFRADLGASSGFQSWQYRRIEFALGNRDPARTTPPDPEAAALLRAELARPSLYDEAVRFLARRGLAVPGPLLARDLAAPWVPDDGLRAVWERVYRAPTEQWEAYELAEKLVDLEDYFRRWRFNHVTTVERVIGFKPGTGGTAGVAYLRRRLEVRLFPELWDVRTHL